jgi:flagellar export protein FliJ
VSPGFRLAAVQRLRTRRFEEAGWALAQARQTLVQADARRETLVGRLRECQAPRIADPVAVSTIAERRAQLRDLIAAAETGIAELTTRAATARDVWLAARGDLRAVEALHERFRQARRLEQDRRDQRLADDLASVRHRPGAARAGREGGAG